MTNFELQTSITEELKPVGFKKKGPNWYLDGAETVCLLNLQKSNFGEQYYLNLGVLIKRLSDDRLPKENHCHIRGRLSQICLDEEQLERDLNFEDYSKPTANKIADVVRVIREFGIPFFHSSKTLVDLKRQLAMERFTYLLTSLEARKLLDEIPA